jgi:hypothetical protein
MSIWTEVQAASNLACNSENEGCFTFRFRKLAYAFAEQQICTTKSSSHNLYLGSRTSGRSFPQAARKPEPLARPAGQDAGIGLLFAYIRQFNPTIFQNGEDKYPPVSIHQQVPGPYSLVAGPVFQPKFGAKKRLKTTKNQPKTAIFRYFSRFMSTPNRAFPHNI